ncbi:deoxyribonuclease-1 isoform X1 [Zootoca vivipara]|uniref:deoxyribonuclease-1 isoform X1 n=1 Tax=Zootoca vivipara TaxID=8524 RepID=UPI00293BC6E9|nr:deoxyribonuclease-1 isoform X1 [Zootoca vivipara]XP_034988096.2 deoxyribonuclease-1 isoform X1 [Zootoca vivipara]
MRRTMTPVPVLVFLSMAAHLLQPTLCLRVGAFNIKTFGDSKLSNETITNFIVNILSSYDITLIQEVRDANLSAVKKLMNHLKQASPYPYGYVVSKPLGRNSYKEQYLFIYREDNLILLDSYHYDDGCEPCGNDTFSREPFIVRFAAPQAEMGEVTLVPLHAAPNEAVAEIDALYDVFLDVRDKWGTEDMLFLGDFNAGCSYVRPEDWPRIRLRTNSAFQWLIPDTADTTVTNTHCAYDRIVAVGPRLRSAILPGSAKVNDFQQTFKLQQKDALAVSDHFPVEVTLKSLGISSTQHTGRPPRGLQSSALRLQE